MNNLGIQFITTVYLIFVYVMHLHPVTRPPRVTVGLTNFVLFLNHSLRAITPTGWNNFNHKNVIKIGVSKNEFRVFVLFSTNILLERQTFIRA